MRIEKAVRIAAPPVRVFGLITEADEQPRWQAGLEQVVYDGPLRAGTAFAHHMRQGNRAAVYRGTVVACERPSRFALDVDVVRFRMAIDYRLEPAGEGTRVVYTASAQERSRLDRALGVVFAPVAGRMAAKRLKALKELAEERSATRRRR